MRKLLLIFSLVLFTTLGYSQIFKRVSIDSVVSVSIPPIYTKKDTLGQQTFSAKASYGFIVITLIPNGAHNTPLKKEKDLNKVFKNYVKDVQQVGDGSILDERDTTLGTLKGHLFTLRTEDDNGNIQFRKFLFLYTQDVSYTFQYFYNDAQSEIVSDEVKTFYTSIKLAADLQRNDQYLIPTKPGMPGGLKFLFYGGGSFIIILIIVFTTIRRRKRKEQ